MVVGVVMLSGVYVCVCVYACVCVCVYVCGYWVMFKVTAFLLKHKVLEPHK